MLQNNLTIPDDWFENYLSSLIGKFYKIIPIKENGEPSLNKYMESLQRELIGCKDLIALLENDDLFLSLIFTLQYLIENDCEFKIIRSEIFKSINICKKLQAKYSVKFPRGEKNGRVG